MLEESKEFREGDTMQKIKQVDLDKYKFRRPNFCAFIKHLLPEESDPQILQFNPPYPDWLHATCRGIMDSKYNEFLLDMKYKRCTRFPDFVYSWLGHFHVDKNTRLIEATEYYETEVADGLRKELLAGLQSTRGSKLWEFHLFKDFLEERYQGDELIFFLHCRNLLFKGPQLSTKGSTKHLIQDVTLENVLKLISVVLKKSQKDDMKRLKETFYTYMKANSKKSTDLLIDASLVLRILLEYFHREKKVRFTQLESIYEDAPKIKINHKTDVSFTDFRQIMSQFDNDMADVDVLLYIYIYILIYIGFQTISRDSE